MIRIDANKLGVIPLGRNGENLARQIVFDISCWKKEFGDGIPQLIHQRAGDSNPYPVAVIANGDLVIWHITYADTGVASEYGRCELRYYVEDILVKSKTWLTIAEPSITSSIDEDVPPANQSWVDQVVKIGVDAETAKKEAEAAASNADTAKKAAERSASDAQTAADRAEKATVNTPKVQNGNWWVYDQTAGAYEDSGIAATGPAPVKGVDYGTQEEIAEISQAAADILQPDINQLKSDIAVVQEALVGVSALIGGDD